MAEWHRSDIYNVIQRLGSDRERGLSRGEAQARRKRYGPNELIEKDLKSPWLILWEQLTATMVLLLISAAVISAFVGDLKDTLAIITIVVLNALLGFNQEYKAEKAIAALKKMAQPRVRIKRDSELIEISAAELVPGDIIFLEAGSFVPADVRLIECFNLRTLEAALTGESEPVEKDPKALVSEDLPIGDRSNMAYMGTTVTYGRSSAVVVDTGMQTELGKIASMIQKVGVEETPLQKRMDQLGKWLVLAAVLIVIVIFSLGLIQGQPFRLMLLTAVSMAVAAVPEGLPAVVTIALALGAQRMLKRRALIRKLPAVETLGSVTVICSDKTGTLTENKMTVTVLDIAGEKIEMTECMRGDSPSLNVCEEKPMKGHPALSLLLLGGALCNDAVLKESHDRSKLQTIGDPTEGAIVIAAARSGLIKNELEELLPRISEIPFESERKLMTTVHEKIPNPKTQIPIEIMGKLNSKYIVFTKGAVDSLLGVSTKVWNLDHAEVLDESWRKRISEGNDGLAKSGTRVLGVAYKLIDGLPGRSEAATLEKDLIFVGMVGMIDPPRPEVKEAVEICRGAGIRPVMITGDHPLTAVNIAKELNIYGGGRVVTGQDLSRMSVADLGSIVDEVSVYARVSPEHKLNIVSALQSRNNIVAMTGDGVNDAPALKKADIGVAMGLTGTDVAREASDMVLLDDNFATIVSAVKEGRVIYDNIRKFMKYLLASNSGEIWVMLFAPFFGMPLPLLPLQILWINLVTDGLPALALGVEPAESDIMKRPPVKPNESIFARGLGIDIIWIGFVVAAVSLGAGLVYYRSHIQTWQTMVFTILTLSQMALALAVRSEKDLLFKAGIFSNISLLAAVTLTFVLQLAVIYLPFMQSIFKTKPLSASDLMLCFAACLTVFLCVEIKKLFARR